MIEAVGAKRRLVTEAEREETRAEARERRARQLRRARRAEELSGLSRTGRLGVTEAASVTKQTLVSYRRSVERFLVDMGLADVPKQLEALDRAVAAFFDDKYLEGKCSGAGSTLLAALHMELPSLVVEDAVTCRGRRGR